MCAQSKIFLEFAFALYCSEMSYTTHQADIDNFYYDIVNTVKGVLENIFLHENVSTFYCTCRLEWLS